MSARSVLTDAAALALFLLLAVAQVAGRSQGVRPFHMLTGDASFYASVAAARDQPGLFAGDGLLSDLADTSFLHLAQIPLVSLAARLTGDYGSGSVLLLGPHVLLQLTGFYVLGRCLFRSPFWAVVLALLTAAHRAVGFGEYWGLNHDVQPRFGFQALWPFALAAAVRLSSVPRAWPWLLAAVGPLAFVHPVSTPALAASLWLGFIPMLPREWSRGRTVGHMLLTAAGFAATLAPYLVVYARGHQRGRAAADTAAALTVAAETSGGHVLSVTEALATYGRDVLAAWPYAAAAAGAVLLWRVLHDRRRLAMLGLWMAGVVVAGALVPAILQAYARAAGMLPLDTQLVRSLRYLLPLALVAVTWAMAEASARAGARPLKAALAAAGVAATLLWWWQNPAGPLRPGLRCWMAGRFYCPPDPPHEATVGIEAVRRLVPPRASLVATRYERQIRYAALRPVAYAEKDGELFAYSNHRRLLEWAEKQRQMRWIHGRGTRRTKLRELAGFARRNGAGYVFVNFPVTPPLLEGIPLTVAWAGEHFALLRVTEADLPPAGEPRAASKLLDGRSPRNGALNRHAPELRIPRAH